MIPDIYTVEKRSQIMSGISGKETKPEIIVRKFLFSKGFRFRKNDVRYPGKPDIVLPKYKTVVLVHGCFWHGHNCPAGRLPETNREFWKEKILSNIKRDERNKSELEELAWCVIVIWQCTINTLEKQGKTLPALVELLMNTPK